MKLYLDQMLHADVTRALRAAGHDVVRAGEVGQARADDEEILERAGQEGRVVVTLDKDFGDWAVLPLRLHGGVTQLFKPRASAASTCTWPRSTRRCRCSANPGRCNEAAR